MHSVGTNLGKGRENGRLLPVVSLFSGSGGLDLGFEQAGFQALLALDNDQVAVDTFNWNRRRRAVARNVDLATATPDSIVRLWQEAAGDVRPVGIIGGPPCQAFSVSNVHRIVDDPRASLPLHYAAILKAFHDRYELDFFLFENVAGLAKKPHAASLDEFTRRFEDAGFEHVTTFIRDAADFGVAQFRNRMFIAGFRNGAFAAPEGDPCTRITVREAIGSLVDPLPHERALDPTARGLHPNHWYMNPRSPKFTNGMLQPGKAVGRSFRVLQWNEPSWTVAYGNREVHVHPNRRRRLSVLEALLLQGFPARYELRGTLSDQIRLVSDAVPPPLAAALATAIKSQLALHAEPVPEEAQLASSGHELQAGLRGVHTSAPRSTKA